MKRGDKTKLSKTIRFARYFPCGEIDVYLKNTPVKICSVNPRSGSFDYQVVVTAEKDKGTTFLVFKDELQEVE